MLIDPEILEIFEEEQARHYRQPSTRCRDGCRACYRTGICPYRAARGTNVAQYAAELRRRGIDYWTGERVKPGPKMRVCPECSGRGLCEANTGQRHGWTCLACGGEGVVPVEEPQKHETAVG